MPGLMRGVARTAAVVGTATAVSGGVSRRQQQKYAAKDQQAAQQQQMAEQQMAPPPPPAAQEVEDPTVAKLKELAALHNQGILTDEEFTAAKAKALGL